MKNWRERLKFDPLPPLLGSSNLAICYAARHDLLDEAEQPVKLLWQLPAVKNILRKQLDSGAWEYAGGGCQHTRSEEDYNQLETFRVLGQIVEKYRLDKRHPAIRRAADYLFACQTQAGDVRGIYGNQYSPNYSAAIIELLIKAGYESDPRIARGFDWLLSVRQQDGGWAIPLRTWGKKFDEKTLQASPICPDTTKPFSHLVTGVVLRAFAAHPKYRTSREALDAAQLLASRLFEADIYPDRRAASFWSSFSYPFWFTDHLSALDSLSLIGITPDDPHIKQALDWFAAQQQEDGLWRLSLLRMAGEKDRNLWVSLAICRVFKRFYV